MSTMKVEIAIKKNPQGNFAVTASSGSFVGKEKLGADLTAKQAGEKIASLIEKLDKQGLIGK